MNAAVYTKGKSGKVLEIKNLEQPIPKDNEVVLRVRAASVNPLDWRMKTERPGVDVAGEIVAVGRAVTQFKPGAMKLPNVVQSLHFKFRIGKGWNADEGRCSRLQPSSVDFL